MMSTSLDNWREKMGWSDKCFGQGLAYNRYLMNVSSLRNLPKTHCVELAAFLPAPALCS